MKTKLVKMKITLTIMAGIAVLAILSGCGGGSTGPTVKSNYGRMAAELLFNGRDTGRVSGAVATGTVNIAITVSGYYSMDDSAFPTLTAQTQIDAAGGNANVSILEVPIGVNHLLTAVATWPDGATDTIKYIIPEVREGELSSAVANYRTTVIANAAIALVKHDEVKLSKITRSQIDTLAAAVDAFLEAGYAASDININDVLDYETTGNVLSTIVVSPATASVTIDETGQFTAAPKNEYGIETTASVTWSVTGDIGTIDSTGLFTATTAGSGTVVATSGTVSGNAQVTVTSSTPTPVCGNGTIETGETCDDGANNGLPNYCNSSCSGTTAAVCGNSIVEAGETCDDGNTMTEECAYGEESCTVCDLSCAEVAGATSYCGDSVTDGTIGETCDDGANNGLPNYCNSSCSGTTAAVCGNSIVEAGETCDDGNTMTEECAYGEESCTVCDLSCAEVAGATSYCGDSVTDGTNGETCDDGANNGLPNYCNSSCSGTTAAVCGNSIVEAGETCDDGNTMTEECAYGEESCTVCDLSCAEVAGATSYCGDSVTDGTNGETCDDGANNGQVGYCNATCDGTILANEWITISAGDFVMGCAAADGSCNADESPKHTVMLSEYKIQKYEVTNAQYKTCVDAAVCAAPSNASSYTHTPYYGAATYDNYPVIWVDWYKASAYCAWIGGRLPSEAEWEKAARGPNPAEPVYPWGNDSPNCTLVNYDQSGDASARCVGDTSEVGAYPTGESSYGAMDMAGNIFEWVNDWYLSDYYTTGGPLWTDPQGPGSGVYTVLRGGSWSHNTSDLRASDRYPGDPTLTRNWIGFRCAQN